MATCMACEADAIPGRQHCYHHLTADQRAWALRSNDEAVRSAATAAIRDAHGPRFPPEFAPVTRPAGQAAMVCPHCQVRGKVITEPVKVKRGVSGGKATGAVLTGGLSLFATGLSRKEWITKARCGNCHQEWTF